MATLKTKKLKHTRKRETKTNTPRQFRIHTQMQKTENKNKKKCLKTHHGNIKKKLKHTKQHKRHPQVNATKKTGEEKLTVFSSSTSPATNL